MTLVVRLLTLFTIAAAGFALPVSCAQNGVAAAAEMVAVEIPAAQQLESPPLDTAVRSDHSSTAHTLAERAFQQAPFDCGKTAPRANDHPATLDTQPFVPGYLTTDLMLDEDRSDSFAPFPVLNPIESRAGPPDAPPPKSID